MWWYERNCARAAALTRRESLRRGAGLVASACLPGAWQGAHAAARSLPLGAAAAPKPGIGEALLRSCGLPGASLGAYARALDSGTPLVALNPEKPFQLASTTKLVTSM